MEQHEIRARIAAIGAEIAAMRPVLDEKVAELDDLIAKLDDGEDAGRWPFKLLKGGLGAVPVPAAALVRSPRHPIAIAATAAATGAMAVVMLAPSHTTGTGPGNAISNLSIPAAPPQITLVSTGRPTPAPTPSAPVARSDSAPRTAVPVRTPSAPAAAPSGAAAPVRIAVTAKLPVPSTTLTVAVSELPTGVPPGLPTPTSTTSCLIKLDVPPILQVCASL